MESLIVASTVFGLVQRVAALPTWGPGWPHNGHWWGKSDGINVQLGPRPFYLVDNMDEGPLKDKLESCSEVRPQQPLLYHAH